MERSVVVRVLANIADLKSQAAAGAQAIRGIGDAAKQTQQRATSAISRVNKSALENREAWNTAGLAITAFGAATLTALVASAKAAIDWETAWTGVLKTVDGSELQLEAVEEGLRDLATTLPATHSEIAAVAEAAGQLGVATPNVVAFTRVMVDLGETTNLTAEEAATSLAQLMNIMQTAPEQVSNLGSALVALGNDGASTERDIVQMAQRIAGAAAIIGLTEGEVLGFANALASVGIQVEAGGSAISRVMTDIAIAVSAGGEEVEGFANVAGVSAQEFARAFETDPARAITLFVEGLGRIDRAGGDVFGTLDDLGQSDIRVSRALLSMAGAGDLLRESLELGNTSFEENNALVAEAEKRYDTTAAKLEVARNQIVGAAISLGEQFLPAIAASAEAVGDFVGFLADLPAPLQTVAGLFAGTAGTVALLGGGLLLLTPRIAATVKAVQDLSAVSPRAATALTRLGKAAALGAGFVAAIGLIEALHQASLRTATSVGEMTEALLDLREGEVHEAIGRLVEERDKLADRNLWLDAIRGLGGMLDLRHDAEELAGEFESIDNALVGLVQQGQLDIAADAVRSLGEQFGLTGAELDTYVERRLPGYVDALAQVDSEERIVAETTGELQSHLEQLAAQFGLTGDDAAAAAQAMLSAWSEGFTGFVDLVGAYDAVLGTKEEAERRTAEETAAATEDATDSWEDYVGDVKVSIGEYLAELERQVEAQTNWATNMLILSSRVSSGTLDQLARLGPEGAALVEELVNASDEELQRFEELSSQRMKGAGDNMANQLAAAGPVLAEIAREHGQDVANGIAQGMAENGTTVQEEAKRQGVAIDEGLGINDTREVPVDVPLPLGLQRAEDEINRIARDRTARINVVTTGGGAGLLRGVGFAHSGGDVTAAGVVPRFHGGGTVGGDGAFMPQLGPREVSIIAEQGELIFSVRQARAFDQFLATLKSMPAAGPRFHDGGPVGSTTFASQRGLGTTGSIVGDLVVENHIEIGGEVVRVVRTEISGHYRNLRRRAGAGTGLAR